MKLPFVKRRLRPISRKLVNAQARLNPGDGLPNWVGFAVGAADTRAYGIEFMLVLAHVCEYGWLAADEHDVIRSDWVLPYLSAKKGLSR